MLGSRQNGSDEDEASFSPREDRNNSEDEEVAGSMINESGDDEMDET